MAGQRISIASPQELVPIDRGQMREIVRAVLCEEGISEAEISLAFVDNPAIHQRNKRLDPSAYCVRGSLLEQNIQYRMVLISNGLRSVLRDKMRAAMPAKWGAAQLVAGSWANGPKYPRP